MGNYNGYLTPALQGGYGSMQNWGAPVNTNRFGQDLAGFMNPSANISPLNQYLTPSSASDTGFMGANGIPGGLPSYTAGAPYDSGSFAGLDLSNPMALTDIGAAGSGSAGFGSLMDWMKRSGMLNSRDQQGWGGLALGAAQGIGNMYMGMQQYGLMKDAFENSKQQFERQFEAQKNLTNSRLEDRQKARVASNSSAYESPDSYMTKYGVK